MISEKKILPYDNEKALKNIIILLSVDINLLIFRLIVSNCYPKKKTTCYNVKLLRYTSAFNILCLLYELNPLFEIYFTSAMI